MKPLQMMQNAVVRLLFNQPKQGHVTPLLIEVHRLPVAALINSLIKAYRVLAGSAPSYMKNRGINIIWQSHLDRLGNQDYFYTLFLNGGTTSQALSEQR